MLSHGDAPCPEPPSTARRTRKATREQLSMAGEIGAYSRWAQYDGRAHAQVMQAGLMDSFRRKVQEADPDVAEPELTRRAECLRKAHMRRLALKSAKVRAERKGAA